MHIFRIKKEVQKREASLSATLDACIDEALFKK